MNVVVIVADTWQFNYLGCYGNSWINTPNIDRLAGMSTVFENAYAEGCPTVPTRRALMTGRYTLPYGGWMPLGTRDQTLTDIMWHEAIRTALIYDTSPMHLPRFGYGRGFDTVRFFRGQEFDHFYSHDQCNLDPDRFHKPVYRDVPGKGREELLASRYCRQELLDYLPQRQHWRGEEDQMVARVAGEAIAYLQQRDKSRPFFLWIDSFDPHEPWDPPSVWDPDLCCPYDPEYTGMEIINPVPTYAEGYLTEAEEHHIRMLYAEKITLVDKWLGKVLDTLAQERLMDDTLVVFLSDHGQPLGRGVHGHGIMRKCRPWPYEELVHIPLIIHCPDAAPRRVASFVQTVDIAPTILSFLGITERGARMQGKNLLPLIRGEKDSVRDFAIAGYYNFSWSMITEDWSYIHWLEEKHFKENPLKAAAAVGLHDYQENTHVWTCTPGSEAQLPRSDELYDRRKDPFQQDNLLGADSGTATDLNRMLFDFMRSLKAEE
ncbi:sulfatase [Desulfatitalea alkaliphila]|uniref:Sulfatase n=1 Tax=Desulfatitalea alkaliphila TaxID=2929485 RepID=A0AA41UJD9_9BACT|nr:sulfatase [Desulfatitalea alkaliphila]MCJ8501044.1 sulfatase [Desulfatitalea alkaliphila]